ncbi:MAG TPA: DegT/DnrJ/EryC1/StrS family aminotransferase [Cytophagaceae bacterium]|jgi:dTDP-4-amino-4,6-dideoxygalactose transaminase
MSIPFVSFSEVNKQIRPEIIKAFEAFFDQAWYVLGDRVKAFESEYSNFNNVTHTVGLSNGLDALYIALKTLEIGRGDEVIVPSNTYIATLLAVSYVGATPVLVEPDIETYNIDPKGIESAITPKTRAIMPVHLYGQACEMEAIMAIANKHGLFVIEDNAQAQAAEFKGKLAGSWGHINATSFYPGKNLGALGDAGAITTDNEELATKAKSLRNYGSTEKYYNEIIGHNMRLDECQAAFLSIKLRYLPQWTLQRQEIASWYNKELHSTGDLILPIIATDASHVYHLYVIRTSKRDALQEHLKKQGIGTLIHYPVPPHLQKAYSSLAYKKGDFPIAEKIADTCLSLPLWPGMSDSAIQVIVKSIKDFYC